MAHSHSCFHSNWVSEPIWYDFWHIEHHEAQNKDVLHYFFHSFYQIHHHLWPSSKEQALRNSIDHQALKYQVEPDATKWHDWSSLYTSIHKAHYFFLPLIVPSQSLWNQPVRSTESIHEWPPLLPIWKVFSIPWILHSQA